MSQQPYYAAGAPVVVQGNVVPAPGPIPPIHYNHGGIASPGAAAENPPIQASTYDHGGIADASQFKQEHLVATEEGGWTKGEPQPKRCNDVLFALLFYAHLGLMAWAATSYSRGMYDDISQSVNYGGGRRLDGHGSEVEAADVDFDEDIDGSALARSAFYALARVAFGARGGGRVLQEGNDDEEPNVEVNDVLFILAITGSVALVVAGLALSFMIHFAGFLVKFALLFNVIISLVVGIGAAVVGAAPVAIAAFVGFAFTAYFAYVVWARVPFAAANLVTAVTSVRTNFGLSFFGYSSLLFMLGWSLWWAVAFVGSMYVTGGCSTNNGVVECENQTNGFLVFLFLVSYYWTHQVIKNTVHVTVAGTVGTWWFSPMDASWCCSRGVQDSFIRAITYSFGSICFGSLIVAIIQATKEFLRQLKESNDSFLLCCAECILGCIERLVEYFNQWAFVYVGLYGYTFMEAGKNVMALFKARGWTTIITDQLVESVLFLVSISVGLIAGLISAIICSVQGLVFEGGEWMPFVVGLAIGFALTSVLMGVVSSAVNTVIVCYAEAPNEFDANYPELSANMRSAWRNAWPTEFKY